MKVEGNQTVNIKFRKRMALLISMCLLFSTFLVDTAAGTGDAPDGSISVPAAEESPEPSVTVSPTPDTTEPFSDEPTVTSAVKESPEPSAPADSTPDTTEIPPSDPGIPADTEAPLYEDVMQTSSSGDEGAPPSVTIELVGGAKGSRFAGMIARSSSPFSITRGQEVELQVKGSYPIRGWRVSNTSIAEIIHTSYSFVVDSIGAYNGREAEIRPRVFKGCTNCV